MRLPFAAALGTFACLAACSTSSSDDSSGASLVSADGARKFCERMVGCMATSDTQAECEKTFSTIILPLGCIDTVLASSCDDLNAPSSKATTTCFPACSTPGSYECDPGGASISACVTSSGSTTGGIAAKYACEGICKTLGAHALGCGFSESKGHDVCKCG